MPDAIAVNPAGYRLLFPGEELSVGKTLELNDRRAKILAIVDVSPAFAANLTIFTRYSLAATFIKNGRSERSHVLELLHDLAVEGDRSVIIVTHDNRIFQFADRMHHMAGGVITKTEP